MGRTQKGLSWGGLLPQGQDQLELLELAKPGAVDWDLEAVRGLVKYLDSSDGAAKAPPKLYASRAQR